MAITIGSNIASLLSQRQLERVSSNLATTNLRLASGSRINSAADDAAGLAISSSLNADVRIFTQALRNLNDGISLIAIAEGALSELSSVLIRQKELTEQSANGVYSNKQRQALNLESLALTNEANRILQTTSFNGLRLLDGSLAGPVQIQAGYGTQGSIAVDLGRTSRKVGDGTYALSAQTPISTNISMDATLGDFNGDGKTDLASIGSNRFAIAFGNGDGSFSALVTGGVVPTADWLGDHIRVGDFNNDGRDDLIAGTPSNVATILLSNGDGTFRVNQTFGSDAVFNAPIDINMDGYLDIVQVGGNSSDFLVALGNGDGSFSSLVAYRHGGGSKSEGLGVADFNNDGFKDVVIANEFNGTIGIALGNGDGSFKAGISFSTNGGAVGFIAISDFNNDGNNDLAVTAQFSAGFSVLLGNGNGSFKAPNNLADFANNYNLATTDANNDGFADMLVSGKDSPLVLRFGNGDGTFKAGEVLAPLSGEWSSTPAIMDINGDQVPDIAYGAPGSDQIFILIGNGNVAQRSLSFSALDLSTQSTSRSALDTIDTYIQEVTSTLATTGAAQSRLETAYRTLQSSRENYSAAESRIKDADIAEEVAAATRLSIIQRVATSVLTQANIQPQIALQLLSN